jgi:hypothetical protein
MRHRSLGVTALAFGTIMLAVYGQYAAIALLLTGSAFTPSGALAAILTLMTGALFMGLTAMAYAMGFGLWTGRGWAWSGSMAFFGLFIVINLFLSVLAGNMLSTVLPTISCLAAMAYLQRPAIRAELLGTLVPAEVSPSRADQLGGAQPVR